MRNSKKRKPEKFTLKMSVVGFISNRFLGWFEPMAVPNGANDPVRRRGVRFGTDSAELNKWK